MLLGLRKCGIRSWVTLKTIAAELLLSASATPRRILSTHGFPYKVGAKLKCP